MKKLFTILLILISCKSFSQEDLPTEKIIRSDTVRVFIVYADTIYGFNKNVYPKSGEMLWQIGYRVKQVIDNGFSVIGLEMLLDRNKKHFTDNYAIFDYRLLK